MRGKHKGENREGQGGLSLVREREGNRNSSTLTLSPATEGPWPQSGFCISSVLTSYGRSVTVVLWICHLITWSSKENGGIIRSTSGFPLQVYKVNFSKSEKRILPLKTWMAM